jgi:hypothetical protein
MGMIFRGSEAPVFSLSLPIKANGAVKISLNSANVKQGMSTEALPKA